MKEDNVVTVNGMLPLSFASNEYMQAHLNFRLNLTDQGDLILSFLQNWLRAHAEKNRLHLFKLASIGSGTGIIDVPLIRHLQGYCSVRYLGIEPNEYENKMAKKALSDVLSEGGAYFFTGLIEELELSEHVGKYDAIVAVHVTYYSANIKPMIRNALKMLHAEHGRLVTIVSANTPQNELFKETTKELYGYEPTLADDYKKLLDDIGVQYEVSIIKGVIDISDFLKNPGSDSSKLFLDFFLHVNSSSIKGSQKGKYIEVIKQTTIERDGKLTLPHIAEVVTT